jgi:hypothetical protein
MLLISNFIQTSENNVVDQKLTPEDIIRKYFYIIFRQRPEISTEYFRELIFTAYSLKLTEEEVLLNRDAYCLWQQLQQAKTTDERTKSDVVRKYLEEIRSLRKVKYKYLKDVRLAALEALEQGSLGDKALQLDARMLHADLQKKN